MIYLAIFFKSNPLKIKTIYEIRPEVMVVETERQLDRSCLIAKQISNYDINLISKPSTKIYTIWQQTIHLKLL